MKITGDLVDILVEMSPCEYADFVVKENGKKVIYVQVLKVIYGMLIAALKFYQKLKKDLESIGFIFNPYDPCVANRAIENGIHTVRFHVDDLMSSHKDPKVNDEFLLWLNKMYGEHAEVKATRGKVHDYLGMKFDFNTTEKVIIDMCDYMKAMVKDFSVNIGNAKVTSPAGDDLFAIGKGKSLDKKRAEEFHTVVAKGLFACKRARPDIHTAIAVLCSRVRAPTEDDWSKLVRLLKFINGTKDDKMTHGANDLRVIKWYVDSSFAVHPDFRSHTGGTMTYGTGAPITMSRKQKINTRSSTEAELVGVDDVSTLILWTKLFLQEQGYTVDENILYQDNKSSILLEKNGKASSGSRTRALNIRYFFITDQVQQQNVSIEHCPTNDMVADYFTKPLQGEAFKRHRNFIMGNSVLDKIPSSKKSRQTPRQ